MIPARTAPGSGSFTHRDRHSVWRGSTLRGEPTIPREIKLCEGNRLDGWISSFYNETQPRGLTNGRVDQNGNPINRAGRTWHARRIDDAPRARRRAAR